MSKNVTNLLSLEQYGLLVKEILNFGSYGTNLNQSIGSLHGQKPPFRCEIGESVNFSIRIMTSTEMESVFGMLSNLPLSGEERVKFIEDEPDPEDRKCNIVFPF